MLTQWFERARFEYHPSNPDPYKVLLGLLGTEQSAERRGEAPFQPAAELDLPHAAAHRAALQNMESLGRPLIYRSDLQEIGDRYAQKFADEGLGGTALDELNEHLHQLPWYANAPI
ncbi:MAG: hypothetical protein KatS3mg057_1668 [Herpetosiphonaceae bacterium]|nr:MAG: hypothetical protein KatS3mg057_1668 [Herpetosiphonaceae bacterium]